MGDISVPHLSRLSRSRLSRSRLSRSRLSRSRLSRSRFVCIGHIWAILFLVYIG